MLVESCRGLSFLPRFSRVIRQTAVSGQFYSTSLTEQLDEVPKIDNRKSETTIQNFRFKYPEFLPQTDPKYRNALREKLERKDMLKRRKVFNIPEFYVGSVLAVTTSDKNAPNKTIKFVGICIHREHNNLASTFILRNVIENQGIEVKYQVYSPVIQSIEVLKLEKRLDDELFYLRDAPYEYSTFPFDMAPSFVTSKIVPVNTLKVPLNPRPWLQRYERMDLKGVILPELPEKVMKKAKERETPWEKYDIMKEYRNTTPEEEQKEILAEIEKDLKKIEEMQVVEKKSRKVFVPVPKQSLF